MAIVRCKHHDPEGRDEPYVQALRPVGYPDTSTICGKVACEQPGRVRVKKTDAGTANHR